MWKILLFLVLSVTIPFVFGGFGIPMIGPGKWNILNLMHCENHEQYTMVFEMSTQKLNRTHDCLSTHINSDRIFDDSLNMELIVYQKVDGGYKFHSKIVDKNACMFMKKYAENNMRRALEMAGVDPPDCPIPAGEVKVKDFVFDYRELPGMGIYGMYDVNLYLSHLGKRVGCLRILVNFEEGSSDEDCDE